MSLLFRKFRSMTSLEIFLRILIVFLIIFCASFFIWYGKTDLFRFPFYSGAWGTASDWAMVVVAISTGVAIWLTLTSQKDVQKAQEISTRTDVIEKTIRYRPKLSVDLEPGNSGGQIFSIESHSKIRFTFVVRNNGAGDIVGLKITSNADHMVDTIFPEENVVITNNNAFQAVMMETSTVGTKTNDLSVIKLTLHYGDVFGNKYKQNARYYYKMISDGTQSLTFEADNISFVGSAILSESIFDKHIPD